MECAILGGMCLFLTALIVFNEIVHLRERERLTDKLIAKSFVEYTNAEIAQTHAKKKEKESEPRTHVF